MYSLRRLFVGLRGPSRSALGWSEGLPMRRRWNALPALQRGGCELVPELPDGFTDDEEMTRH
jgi:hypothetical protein